LHWRAGRFEIDLAQPRVMAIVNVTPDSFSGDSSIDVADALRRCDAAVDEGADIIDIGGESTRPGAPALSAGDELARVLPVLRHAVALGVPVSIDTGKADVIRAALDLGADIVNDVRALQSPGALDAVARHPAAGVCLMHMQGEPASMQEAPDYVDVLAEVRDFLAARLAAAVDAGVDTERIVLDPGIGFGKTGEHNLRLLARLDHLGRLGRPVCLGVSRKGFLGRLLNRPVEERLAASLAAACHALAHGSAHVLRVHDVAATRDAVTVFAAISQVAGGG
jgi:dihydropteroate synthase